VLQSYATHFQISDNEHGNLLGTYEKKGTIEETLTTRRIDTCKKLILEGLTPVRNLSCPLGVPLDPFLRVLNIVVFPS